MKEKTEFLEREYKNMLERGETWTIRSLNGPSQPHVIVEGRKCIMLASNNYLNLANDPRLKEATIKAIEMYGAGAGSDWSIAGCMDVHQELNKKIAEFKRTEAGITYQTGYAVNAGLIPQLAGKGDILISDALNHGSIIDGVRLTKADRGIYAHSNMGELETVLKNTEKKDYRRTIILTDGVFSMDGDIAKMDEIQKLADEYGAMTYVDDAHGEGVLGGGRGIATEFDLEKKIDFQMGTFSKAFGSFGGMLAGSEALIKYAYNTSRTWLLSAAFPPHVAAASLAALNIVEKEPERVKKLWENTKYFKKEIESLGFDTGRTQTPIIPSMIGESKKTQELAKKLYDEGIFCLAIVFPMVARGKARIRNQMNAGMSREDLDEILRAYEKCGKELGII
ncbi:MAG: aminotransferase class I/II-fold pyridoxal phosphate-dependent enzyme [Methanomicrobia archaeon]|nr:aminotransferase class I/II-fold pyridoxal phosphate-dependent enzyme [Methanomicrobia archaeon]MCK4637392.1 aminotransferase class I/II-fold pyridoxal phosphate-dependent enzyme [Methanomicrobia archaeon]